MNELSQTIEQLVAEGQTDVAILLVCALFFTYIALPMLWLGLVIKFLFFDGRS